MQRRTKRYRSIILAILTGFAGIWFVFSAKYNYFLPLNDNILINLYNAILVLVGVFIFTFIFLFFIESNYTEWTTIKPINNIYIDPTYDTEWKIVK